MFSHFPELEAFVFEDAGHAFANPSGTRYKAEAAEDAWMKTLSDRGGVEGDATETPADTEAEDASGQEEN